MEAFRFYEISANLAEERLTGRFIEAAGIFQPVNISSNLSLIDEWKINDDLCGAEILLAIHAQIMSDLLESD